MIREKNEQQMNADVGALIGLPKATQSNAMPLSINSNFSSLSQFI
jgi:hypothetical protein